MTRPYSNDLVSAMARVREANDPRGSGGIADQPLGVSKWSDACARPAACLRADWRPQAALFVGRSRRLAAGPGVVASFTLRGLAAELADAA